MSLKQSIRDKLTLPAVVAPMMLCSGPALATEARKAGIVGSLTANHCRNLEELEGQLKTVAEDVARFADANPDRVIGPFALNIEPGLDAEAMRARMALCTRYGVEIVITAVGNPTDQAPYIREAGMVHFHDATSLRFAEKAIEAGVDGVVAIGAGGGGHSGTVSHLALIPKIRAMFDGTIIAAGAITTGANIRAAEILGADLAYLGTRFIATMESVAPDEYKAMLVSGGVTDLTYTNGINGMYANWLNESVRSHGLDPANLPKPQGRGTGHLPPGIFPWKNVWSGGQGICLIDEVLPVADLVRQLQREYVAACAIPDMAAAARAALAKDSEHV
jgi:nitronate monooxygenase